MRIEVTGGGTPDRARMAALAAALERAARPAAAPGDPLPAAYRSRWRRAALVELSQVPTGIKDNRSPWGGLA